MLNIEQNMVPAISHVLSSLAIVCYSRIEYNLQHVITHFWENFQRHMGMMRCGRESCTFCTFIDSIACKSFKNIPFCCEALKHEIINIYFSHWTRTNYICQLKWSVMNWTTGDTLVYLAIFWLADFFSMKYARCRICLLVGVVHWHHRRHEINQRAWY